MREDGGAVCWGNDSHGQSSPPGSGRFTSISSGNLHTCALQLDGNPACWGAGGNDQKSFPPGEQFDLIDSGRWHVCALREDGSAACWGDNGGGQVSLPQDERFIAVTGGRWHTCALRADGSPVCWGGGPASSPGGERFVSISSGEQHTCALKTDKSAVCWGNNDFGQSSPPEDEQFVAISSGYEHTCAIRDDGSVVCWGGIDAPPTTLLSLSMPDVPTLVATVPTQPPTARGQCSAYDSMVSWLEATYPRYSICYTAEYASDIEFVKRWVDHAQEWMHSKYDVAQWRNGQGQELDLNIMLLPGPNDDADTGLTRFKCCYNASGELDSSGGIAQIPYLTPSHRDWDAYPRWGTLGFPPDDFHAKNLVHEITHVGQRAILGRSMGLFPTWVIEGLAEYEGMFNSTEHNRNVGLDALVRYVHDEIPDSIFLESSTGRDTPSLTTSDEYFGGSLIMKYLADRFGEEIHNRLVRHTHSTFDAALEAEFEAAGTSATQVFKDLQEWLTRKPTPAPEPPDSHPAPSTGRLPDTNNVRWLQQKHPALYLQLESCHGSMTACPKLRRAS